MTRALVIGAGGFVGRSLATVLADQAVDVVGVARSAAPSWWQHEWLAVDVCDASGVEAVVRDTRPDLLFQLAATTGTDLGLLLAVNVLGTQNVLSALARQAPKARAVVAGSAAEYGFAAPDDLPLVEASQLRPVGLYGVSKAAQTLLTTTQASREGLNVCVARTFNLTGPHEPASLVCAAFAAQIARIELGEQEPTVVVGNLDSERDFLDVRDAARALSLLAEAGEAAEIYNVSSGVPTKIRTVLELLGAHAQVPFEVRSETRQMTQLDVPRHYGSPAKLQIATGWNPTVSLEQSLDDLLHSWRERVAHLTEAESRS